MADLFSEAMVPMIPEYVKGIFYEGLDFDGKFFSYCDNIYRGIEPNGINNIVTGFKSGMFAELIKKNLIPDTKVVPYELPGYSLILQHEKIKNVSYNYEWSFSMLKDAALMELDVLEILTKYNYTSKDAHLFNVLFKDNRPVWVDITSLIRSNSVGSGIIWGYFILVYQSLELMSLNPMIARIILKNPKSLQEQTYIHLAEKFGLKNRYKFEKIWRRYMNLFTKKGAVTDKEKIYIGIENFRQKIKKLKLTQNYQWSNYQSNWVNNKKQVVLEIGGGGANLSFLEG